MQKVFGSLILALVPAFLSLPQSILLYLLPSSTTILSLHALHPLLPKLQGRGAAQARATPTASAALPALAGADVAGGSAAQQSAAAHAVPASVPADELWDECIRRRNCKDTGAAPVTADPRPALRVHRDIVCIAPCRSDCYCAAQCCGAASMGTRRHRAPSSVASSNLCMYARANEHRHLAFAPAEGALAAAKALVCRNPTSARPHFAVAQLLKDRAEWRGALAALQHSLQLEAPDHASQVARCALALQKEGAVHVDGSCYSPEPRSFAQIARHMPASSNLHVQEEAMLRHI